ncbi:MAG: hypothetical protein ABEK01_03740 [Candidatus Nanohaloarchaea archaeon]
MSGFLRGEVVLPIWCIALIVPAVLPPLLLRDASRMVPWEVLLIASLPQIQAFLGIEILGSSAVNYVSAAAMSLLVVVNLEEFSGFSATPDFAVIFLTVSTVAWAGTWAVIRWLLDVYLSFSLLPSATILMWEFTGATVAGVLAGIFFHGYLEGRTGELAAISSPASACVDPIIC